MFIRLPSGSRIAIPPFLFRKPNPTDLVIRSGSAFYPDHVTSRMCLGLLEELLSRTSCRSLLDVGCGSGILALAGARWGASFSVGLDIDARAVRISRENASRNGLTERTHWIVGTISAVGACFDCIVANLPYHVMEEAVGDILCRVGTVGSLILSGFHDTQWPAVEDILISYALEVQRVVSGDLSFPGEPPSGSYTWVAVLAQRVPSPG